MSQMWSHPWVAAILAAAVRGAPLILLAGAAALGWRRSSAATRHLVWLVAIAAMLSLPLLSASLPAWRVVLLPAVPEALSSAEAAQPVFDMSDPATTPVSSEESALSSPQPDAMADVAPAPAFGAPARDWGRIAFLIWCAGVVGTIDNVLRPALVGKDAKLPDLLILVGTIGGLFLFGPIGFIVGPVVCGLFLTVWEIYGATFRSVLPPVHGERPAELKEIEDA